MTDIGISRRLDTQRMISALVVSGVTLAFLISAYQYPSRSGEFPLIIGWTTMVLCLLDLVASTPTTLGEKLTAFLHRAGPARPQDKSVARRELIGLGWIAAAAGLVAVAGFLIAIPVYVFGFMTIHGRKPPVRAAITAGLTTLVLYAVFEWLLHYELYRGAVFG